MLRRNPRVGTVAPEPAMLSQKSPAFAVAPPSASGDATAIPAAPLLSGRDGVRLSFRIPTATHRRLRLAALRCDKTLAGMVEQLVGEHLPAA